MPKKLDFAGIKESKILPFSSSTVEELTARGDFAASGDLTATRSGGEAVPLEGFEGVEIGDLGFRCLGCLASLISARAFSTSLFLKRRVILDFIKGSFHVKSHT